jgi:hypothetical protein
VNKSQTQAAMRLGLLLSLDGDKAMTAPKEDAKIHHLQL